MVSIETLYDHFLASTGVQTDTRNLQANEMFISLKGENFNGNLYADKAIENGASCAVVDEEAYANPTKNIFLVKDGLEALQQLATHHRKQLNIPFLAITGSNGKTTTKELMAAVLQKKFKVLATVGNFNNHIGVPLTLLNIKESHEFAIIEMGANHQGEIASYCEWALPDFALINNCGKAHLEGFGGIEGVRKGKGELYDFIDQQGGTIFRNADYDYLQEMSQGIDKQITYGEHAGDYRAKIYEHEPFLKIAITNAAQEQLINTQLVGDYNLANVLAAWAVGNYFGVKPNEIVAALQDYHPTNNRSEYKVVNGVHVILDAYNANPTSMKSAMQSFSHTSHEYKTVMLGAMMELGTESENEHADVLQFAMEYPWKNIVLVGQEFKQAAEQNKIVHFGTAQEARDWFRKNIGKGEWVYIKGSRLTAMEQIIT